MDGKIIILCLDGTWNDMEFGACDTNVVRLWRLIGGTLFAPLAAPPDTGGLLRTSQTLAYRGRPVRLYYERGVGTAGVLDKFVGGGFGLGLDANVRRAYRFLSRNYAYGDDVFVFGFSRGAYTARSLVGYLGAVGLLRPERCLPENEALAWNLYRMPRQDRSPGAWRALGSDVFDRGALEVACLGVFDTVGALGIPLQRLRRQNRQAYQFHDLGLSPLCRVHLQALAIDEHRAPFEATLWREAALSDFDVRAEQVWFPGAHADVGGGFVPADQEGGRLDDLPLDWMLRRLAEGFEDFPAPPRLPGGGPRAALAGPQHDPRYPLLAAASRSIGNTEVTRGPWQRIRLVGRDRHSPAVNEMVHLSALRRLGAAVEIQGRRTVYGPENLLAALPLVEQTYSGQPPVRRLSVVGDDGRPLSPDDAGMAAAAREAVASAYARLRSACGFRPVAPVIA